MLSGGSLKLLTSAFLLRQLAARSDKFNTVNLGSEAYGHLRSRPSGADGSQYPCCPELRKMTLEESADIRKRAVVGMGVYRGTAIEESLKSCR